MPGWNCRKKDPCSFQSARYYRRVIVDATKDYGWRKTKLCVLFQDDTLVTLTHPAAVVTFRMHPLCLAILSRDCERIESL